MYLPKGGTTALDLSTAPGTFSVAWFNPRTGGTPAADSSPATGGTKHILTTPSTDDWLAVIRRK